MHDAGDVPGQPFHHREVVLHPDHPFCRALGVFTTLAEARSSIKDWLSWKDDVGPLSGKTGMAVIVWLIAWAVLHAVYRDRPFESRRALTIALVLVGLGALGTFPIFFQAFASE